MEKSTTADVSGPATVEVHLPAPTAAPLVVSTGVVLLCAGIATSYIFSGVGAVVLVWGLAAWIRQLVLPIGGETLVVPVTPLTITSPVKHVQSAAAGVPNRAHLPEQYHPYSAGAKGGLVGGAAMAATALAYGLLSGHGLWYPINLLAALLLPQFGNMTTAELETFSATGLLVAIVIHLVASVGLGLIYGVMLPTLPGWWLLTGGIVAPLLWTGAIYSSMGILNPTMNDIITQREVMPWFVVSQFAFGLGVDLYIMRTGRIRSQRMQESLPLDELDV